MSQSPLSKRYTAQMVLPYNSSVSKQNMYCFTTTGICHQAGPVLENLRQQHIATITKGAAESPVITRSVQQQACTCTPGDAAVPTGFQHTESLGES
jgi:hypothetical protein